MMTKLLMVLGFFYFYFFSFFPTLGFTYKDGEAVVLYYNEDCSRALFTGQ